MVCLDVLAFMKKPEPSWECLKIVVFEYACHVAQCT